MALTTGRVSKITAPLLASGWITETETRSGAAGRPVRLLSPVADTLYVLGIKLAQNRAYATWMDAAGGEVYTAAVEVGADAGLTGAVDAIAELYGETPESITVSRIGVSISATVDPDGRGVHDVSYLGWESGQLASLVEARIAIPIVLSNDVNAVTIYQDWFGCCRGAQDIAVLTIGTGIGCGIIANGEVIHGVEGRSGLISHLPIDASGPFCDLGHRGCLSAFAATGPFLRSVRTYLPEVTTIADVVSAGESGNRIARAHLDEAGRAIGQALALIVNMIGPQSIVVTGDGIQLYVAALAAVDQELDSARHWRAAHTEVVIDDMPLSAWSRGAATVALRSLLRTEVFA